jgi:hypothetical protein
MNIESENIVLAEPETMPEVINKEEESQNMNIVFEEIPKPKKKLQFASVVLQYRNQLAKQKYLEEQKNPLN